MNILVLTRDWQFETDDEEFLKQRNLDEVDLLEFDDCMRTDRVFVYHDAPKNITYEVYREV